MPTFDVHVFLTDCFIQQSLHLRPDLTLTPAEGPGSADIAEVMNRFCSEFLGHEPMPDLVRATQAAHGTELRSVVVVSIEGIVSNDRRTAMLSTQSTVMAVQDSLALCQKTRGEVAGFYVIQTDVDPLQYYVEPRVPSTRRIYQLGPGSTEDVVWAVVEGHLAHPLLRTYLSLYSDIIRADDHLRPGMTIETKLTKTWTLLETMADRLSRKERNSFLDGAKGDRDVLKVRALYVKYGISEYAIPSRDGPVPLLEAAYSMRGVFVHAGSCQAATHDHDKQRCARWGERLHEIAGRLEADCGRLIMAYLADLFRGEHPEIDFGHNDQLTTITRVTLGDEHSPSEAIEFPGVAALVRRSTMGKPIVPPRSNGPFKFEIADIRGSSLPLPPHELS